MFVVTFDAKYFFLRRRRLRKPHSMFDRRALEAFFKNRRNALSNAKKAKMKNTKQQQQQQPQQQHPASATMRQQTDMQMVRTKSLDYCLLVFLHLYGDFFFHPRSIRVQNGLSMKTGLCFR